MLGNHLVSAFAGLPLSVSCPVDRDTGGETNEVDIATAGDSFAYTAFFAAMSTGEFDNVGLTVNFQKIGSGSKAAAAMIAGDDNLYQQHPDLLNARKQGVDLVVVAAITTHYISSVKVSEKWAREHNKTANSPIENKTLEDNRIGVTGLGRRYRLFAADEDRRQATERRHPVQQQRWRGGIASGLLLHLCDSTLGLAGQKPRRRFEVRRRHPAQSEGSSGHDHAQRSKELVGVTNFPSLNKYLLDRPRQDGPDARRSDRTDDRGDQPLIRRPTHGSG